MKKRKFPIFLILGVSLILLGFAMMVALQIRVHVGADRCRATAVKMEQMLPPKSVGLAEAYSISTMPILEISGVDYVALLEIPAFGLSLPVADKWDSSGLLDAPARFCGSAYNRTLAIGGVDYSYQFAFCDKIDNGSAVLVTDMTGVQFSYTVIRVDRSKNADNGWIINENYDLTLFCRDVYSMEYIAVRCNMMYN